MWRLGVSVVTSPVKHLGSLPEICILVTPPDQNESNNKTSSVVEPVIFQLCGHRLRMKMLFVHMTVGSLRRLFNQFFMT